MTADQRRFAPYAVAGIVLIDVIFALAGGGPPGASLWTRVLCMVLVGLIACVACIVIEGLLSRIPGLAQRRRVLVPLVCAGMIAVMGPVTWGIAAWLAPSAQLSTLLTYTATWAAIIPVVALFGPMAMAVRRLVVDIDGRDLPRAQTPMFLQRLPAELYGARLWAIEAQDHYLRLHTSKGRTMILMRLADAIAELEGLEGARVHRSWWAAREAVAGVSRTEGRIILRLRDGGEVPVSRTYAPDLRKNGWI